MTQPTLFDTPWHGPELPDGWDDWTELVHSNGRPYRWRLDTVREYDVPLSDYVDRAPPPHRWELEVCASDGSWRVVRLHTRRDVIWASLNLNEAAEVAD